ncbi:MFS transporter [Homoserinibacter sp. YIM 151385]|uniref:MFS transporter n=1 Tax=Homoserinibacter sp. YIM 151385 TaxID=2985506 RepID=UPI0022F083D0|nr:MFS transporter [Homoserinibacter sp. YIM 151385]WBU39396.1 MFS transporter [Homoserinibacter sp. YIM 151385]
MVGSFMQTILIPIQGELPELLNASRDDTAWVITITLLVSAICTPITGKLGDMFGKRRIALILLSLLVAGSVVAALSPTVVPLIIGRGLQGLGMGVIPLGITILRDVLPSQRLGSAIALVSATLGVGGALGLPLSAFVTQNADWHMLFWLAAALGVIVLALIAWIVPESPTRTGGRVDVVGVIGLAIGLTGILLAVSRGNEWGWVSPLTLGLLLGGVLVLLLWGWWELRTSAPLVDLRVSARGPVLITNLASIAMGFALFSSQIAFPQLLEMPAQTGGIGLTLLQASFILMPAGLAMLAMSPIAGRLERTWGPKPLFIMGGTIIAAGYLVAVLMDLGPWHILTINLLIGIGIGLGYAAMPTLIMRAVPDTETGAANGLNTLMRALGTATASAVIAAVLANSTTVVGGVAMPTTDGFQTAFLFGLAAALIATVIAVFIPKPVHHAGEHEALTDDQL